MITNTYNRHHIGEVFTSNEGYELKIIDGGNRIGYNIILVNNNYKMETKYQHIKKGNVKNLYHKSIYNIGYLGKGRYSKTNAKKAYRIWQSMLARCYDEDTQFLNPTYKGVIVREEWHNFQNFAKWHEDNYIEGFEIDKDILSKNKVIYSPDTCCFVPREINFFMRTTKPNSTSNYRGVRWDNYRKQWGVQITINYNTIDLGWFKNKDNARIAYIKAREKRITELCDKYENILSVPILENMKLKG